MEALLVHCHLVAGSSFLIEIQKVCWVYVVDGELCEILLSVYIFGLEYLTASLPTVCWLVGLRLEVLLRCDVTFSRLTRARLSSRLLASVPASCRLSRR